MCIRLGHPISILAMMGSIFGPMFISMIRPNDRVIDVM